MVIIRMTKNIERGGGGKAMFVTTRVNKNRLIYYKRNKYFIMKIRCSDPEKVNVKLFD